MNAVKTKNPVRTVDITLTALFTALIILAGTVLKIPLPPPMPALSTQFFFCAMAGILLGKKLGTLSVLLYVLLGLMGLPVFTTGGGPSYVLMPSFGYLVGFIGAAFIAGLVREKCELLPSGLKIWHLFLGCLGGLAFTYLCGVTHLYFIKNFYTHDNMSLLKAIQVGMLIFVAQDSIWCVVAALIGRRLLKVKKSFEK